MEGSVAAIVWLVLGMAVTWGCKHIAENKTRSTMIKKHQMADEPDEYDVRVTVDEASFTLRLQADNSEHARDLALEWAAKHIRGFAPETDYATTIGFAKG